METLKIDFESTFEALPGLLVLLHNDPVHFPIISVTRDYAAKVHLTVHELRGRSIFDLSRSHGIPLDQQFRESLETAGKTGLPHSYHVSSNHGDTVLTFKISNHPVKSGNGDAIVYIIHTIYPISDWQPEIAKKPDSSNYSFDSIIEQAPVAISIVRGPQLIIETANSKMIELWGKTKSLIGQPLLDALPELVNQPFPALMQRVYETGLECTGTETKAYLQREGVTHELYFNFHYAPLRNKEGKVDGIVMMAADVTPIVRAKRDREESEKRYRDLIENATVATAIYVGPEMIIQLANEAMIKLWGKATSVIGKPLREALPELEGQPFLELLRHVYETGETYHSKEDRADLVVDGELRSFYFNFTYKALRDTEGKIYGILNMAVDVTESVITKLEIKEAEERWRIALHSAALGAWDYYPVKKHFVCSSRTKELFGFPKNADVSFEVLMEAVREDDRERVRQEIRKSLTREGGASYRVEFRVLKAEDKKERWLRAMGQAFYLDTGEAYRLTGTVLDITDRKKIEEALEERVNARTSELMNANRELERSNQELEQYAYVASHDLQEPLRKILVYSDLLKGNVPLASTSNEERLEKIIGSARRMSHLIQDLLNFSKFLRSEKRFTDVDLNNVVKTVLEDFELTIIETKAQIAIDQLPTVEGSEHELGQLFYNLISNALKFRKESQAPVIQITSRKLSKEALAAFEEVDKARQYVLISVKDNGIGFDQKYGQQIFDIFKRLNTRSKFEGTGIGLAVCRKIITSHNGAIFAESVEGSGATFNVILPAASST